MRILLRTLLCFTLVGGPVGALRAEGPLHLFILSGQSNMARLDPAVSFTPAVEAAYGKANVLVVKDAEGGQPIRRWDQGWKTAAGEHKADLYARLLAKVKAATKGKPLASITFCWMQGERDAKEKNGDVYGESLKRVIAQLQKDLGREDIHVVIGRLSDFGLANAKYPHWTRLREIQTKLAEENPAWDWVETDDLNGAKNDLHLTAEGYRILGERFAAKASELIAR